MYLCRDKHRQHQSLHDITQSTNNDSTGDLLRNQAGNQAKLVRATEVTQALRNSSGELLETLRQLEAQQEIQPLDPLPAPFVRRMCGIRKKSDHSQPGNSSRLSRLEATGPSTDGAAGNDRLKTINVRAVDVNGLEISSTPRTVL